MCWPKSRQGQSLKVTTAIHSGKSLTKQKVFKENRHPKASRLRELTNIQPADAKISMNERGLRAHRQRRPTEEPWKLTDRQRQERVLAAANREMPDRVPMDFQANPWSARPTARDLGSASTHRELLDRLGVDILDLRAWSTRRAAGRAGVPGPRQRRAGELLGLAAEGRADGDRPGGLLR